MFQTLRGFSFSVKHPWLQLESLLLLCYRHNLCNFYPKVVRMVFVSLPLTAAALVLPGHLLLDVDFQCIDGNFAFFVLHFTAKCFEERVRKTPC